MKWIGRRQSDNVEDRRGMSGGKVAIGGGVIGIIVIVINLLMGGDPNAVLNQLQQQSSAADVCRDCCPACKQPLVLPLHVASAVDSAVAAALKDAAAAARAETLARERRDARERQLAKSQRRQELLDKFTSAPKCCVCVRGAHRCQSTKYFMHAFGE